MIAEKSHTAQNIIEKISASAAKVGFMNDSTLTKALMYLENTGIPNNKTEDYKYCNMDGIFKKEFKNVEQKFVEINDIEKYKELKTMFGKSLCVNKNIQAGDIIRIQDLESKKPASKGIPASRYQEILGKKTRVDLKQWDFVNFEQLEI